MGIGFLVNKKIGFVILVIISFIVAVKIALPLSIRLVKEGETPEVFNVLIYDPPNTIQVKRLNELNGSCDRSFLLPIEKVNLLNQELATTYHGTRSFEILAQETDKQYIHFIINTDDNIVESWYWATSTHVVPVKYRWLNLGVIVIVLPLTFLFTILGVCIYYFIYRVYWKNLLK
jgi:hypothetical protein